MSERIISKLYGAAGGYGPEPGEQSYVDFQNWLDDRRRLPTPRMEPNFKKVLGGGRRKCSRPTVREIISQARKREREESELTASEKKELAARLTSWLTKSYYADYLRCLNMGAFFFEPDLLEKPVRFFKQALLETDASHYRKYMDYAFCAFVDLFRPGALHWQTADKQDMRLARSLLSLFSRFGSDEVKRHKFIYLLFDKREELEDIGKQFGGTVSDEQKRLLMDARTKYPRWKDRISYLHENGFKAPGGKNLLTVFRDKKTRLALIRYLQRLQT